MNPTAADIEQIVRLVLQRLGSAATGNPAPPSKVHEGNTGSLGGLHPKGSADGLASDNIGPALVSNNEGRAWKRGNSNLVEGKPVTALPAASAGADQAVVEDRVVSMALLKDKLDGARTLVIPESAIVTPAARDELKVRGVTLLRGGPTMARTASGRRLLVACCGQYSIEPICRVAVSQGFCVEVLGQAPADALAAQLGRRLLSGDRAIMVCDQPAAALCYANRHWQIRAAWGVDRRAVRSARTALDPNVLVVEPSRAGQSLDQIVAEFLKPGAD